jgi:hypothetical protein
VLGRANAAILRAIAAPGKQPKGPVTCHTPNRVAAVVSSAWEALRHLAQLGMGL